MLPQNPPAAGRLGLTERRRKDMGEKSRCSDPRYVSASSGRYPEGCDAWGPCTPDGTKGRRPQRGAVGSGEDEALLRVRSPRARFFSLACLDFREGFRNEWAEAIR